MKSMNQRISIPALKKLCSILLLLFIIGSALLSGASGEKVVIDVSKEASGGAQQNASHNNTESFYKNLLKQTLGQFNDDLNQSSLILDEFVKKNISNREAMIASTSLYVLTSQTLESFNITKPPKEYSNNYNSTINALTSLKAYFWNIAKFYETSNVAYAKYARKNFNASLYYYEKGLLGLSS